MAGISKTDAWMLAGATTLAMTLSYVDRQAFSLLAPRITEVFHISEAGYGRLASAFSIAYLAGGPVAGLVIDRVGARRGLLGAVLVWSVVAAAHAVAPGVAALFALRLALGLAESPT
ncbi:MAG TPA: MFS transporter, partial [Polyangiaceae bacterium]|nr:MFS transporter [Polyangiaceae bacterium]